MKRLQPLPGRRGLMLRVIDRLFSLSDSRTVKFYNALLVVDQSKTLDMVGRGHNERLTKDLINYVATFPPSFF